jgi:hypothetical protein
MDGLPAGAIRALNQRLDRRTGLYARERDGVAMPVGRGLKSVERSGAVARSCGAECVRLGRRRYFVQAMSAGP